MVDVPINWGTDTGAGGVVRGDYCVLNPLDAKNISITNGNLTVTYATASWSGGRASFVVPKTGSWKWEVTPTTMSYGFMSIATSSATLTTSGYNDANVFAFYLDSGEVRYGGTNQTTVSVSSVNDVHEWRISNGAVTLYRNNTLLWTYTQTLNDISGDYFPAVWIQSGAVHQYNFGQRPWTYSPSGYSALCTQNLPVPTILNGANYMAATLYTGNSGTNAISNAVNNTIGTTFQPDLVWVKSRSAATDHKLTDSVRGTTKALISDTTGVETTDTNGLTAFGTTGFTIGSDTTYNNSGATYVGWQWKGGGTAVTNTAGSITSSVSANTTAGFSVVTYTGTIANATVGHGLGVAPRMIIARNRTNVVNWIVYHANLTSASYYLTLDETNGQTNNSIFWQGVAPTSTVFSLGANSSCNGNTSNVAYCFAPIAGYSAFTTYTGNGSGDGPFVYCGFRPRYLMIKRYDAAGDPWWVIDSSRSSYNQTTLALRPNGANAEDNGGNANFDFLANGFKARTSGGGNGNESGATYIVAAFAENPFNISRAR
jgi:hypothetical protein